MPRITEYTAKDTKLQPLAEGGTAWTGAGRRIAPAYNEAASLIRESQKGIVEGGQDIANAAGMNVRGAENVEKAYKDVAAGGENIVKAAGEQTTAQRALGQAQVLSADQQEKFEKALLSQYKDLFDIGETKAARGSGGGGGGGLRFKGDSDPFGILKDRPLGGGGGGYGAASEILGNMSRLTNPGGKAVGPSSENQSGRGLYSPSPKQSSSSGVGTAGQPISETFSEDPMTGDQDYSGGYGNSAPSTPRVTPWGGMFGSGSNNYQWANEGGFPGVTTPDMPPTSVGSFSFTDPSTWGPAAQSAWGTITGVIANSPQTGGENENAQLGNDNG